MSISRSRRTADCRWPHSLLVENREFGVIKMDLRSGSYPSTIHDILLVGASACFLGCKEYGKAGNIFRIEFSLETLSPEQLGLAFRGQPLLDLALGHDPARRDRVDANIVRAKVARERTGEPENCRLCRGIVRHSALADHPGHRAEIDDGPVLGSFHVVQNGLRGEELEFQLRGESVFAIYMRHRAV